MITDIAELYNLIPVSIILTVMKVPVSEKLLRSFLATFSLRLDERVHAIASCLFCILPTAVIS